MIRRSAWLVSTGLFVLATPAVAQNTDTASKATQASPTEQAGVIPQAQAASQANQNEIVITAQGRRQVLQDVPIAVTAVNANEMRNSGASDIRQLNQLAPSLLVSSTGSEANGSARIRGIGTVGDNPGLESSVAVFIDGVYRSRSGIGLNELGEIDRIEVLRGPQGTLFGRNASAGIINIFTKAPSFNTGGYGEITYGNYNLWRFAGGVTGQIAPSLAARLDAVLVKRDGFYKDPANDTTINNRNRFFTRGQLLYEPSDRFSIRIIGDYTHRDERCCAAVYVDNSVNPGIGNLNEVANPLLQPGATPARTNDAGNNIVNVLRDLGQNLNALHSGYSRVVSVTPGRDYSGKTIDYGLSGQVDWDLGAAKLTSITAYRHYRADQGGDIDYSTVDILYRSPGGAARKFNTFSQELRLQGNAGPLDWLVGGYFANEDLKLPTTSGSVTSTGASPPAGSCRRVRFRRFTLRPVRVACPSAHCPSPAAPAFFGAASPIIYTAFQNLDSLNNLGSTRDVYNQNSKNWALFTHNIFHVTSKLDLTVGLRYTHETKKLDTTFGNDNTVCTANQSLLSNFVNPAVPSFNATWRCSRCHRRC